MAKKDKGLKLPKKVGGVKVPKDLRKTAAGAIKLAQNPIAREIVSAAVVAGAAALARSKQRKASPPPAAAEAADAAKAKPSELGALLAQGVAAFVNAFDKASATAAKTPPTASPTPKTRPAPKK